MAAWQVVAWQVVACFVESWKQIGAIFMSLVDKVNLLSAQFEVCMPHGSADFRLNVTAGARQAGKRALRGQERCAAQVHRIEGNGGDSSHNEIADQIILCFAILVFYDLFLLSSFVSFFPLFLLHACTSNAHLRFLIETSLHVKLRRFIDSFLFSAARSSGAWA